MSNSGSGKGMDRADFERALADLRHVLDTKDVVGWPKRHTELYELERLIRAYPAEAARLVAELDPRPGNPPAGRDEGGGGDGASTRRT